MNPYCQKLKERGGWWEDVLVPNCEFPIAPRNTWSNLAYILAGIVVYLLEPTATSFTMGLAFVFLGVTSGLYHGTKRGWAAKLDHAGMYAAFIALLISRTYTGPIPVPAFMLLTTVLVMFLMRNDQSTVSLYSAMGIAVFFGELAAYLQDGYMTVMISMSLFVAAYSIWWMDKLRVFAPAKWGHAFWHILTAAAMTILYLGV